MVTIEQLRGETYMGGDPVVKGMYEENRAFLDEVLELARRQRLVPFVGAGFSQFFYRGWGSLLRGMAGRYPDCQEELEKLLERGEYEDAASLLQEEMGARGRGRRDVFLRAIDGEFGEGTVEGAFAEMSAERRGIPRVFRGPILTTNYDLLIERAYREAGADGVVIAEPLAGMLSPDLCAEFSEPYIRRIVQSCGADDFLLVYHNCGNGAVRMLDSILNTGCDMYHFGDAVDMREVLKRMPQGVIALGNVSPANEFLGGTPKSVYEATQALLRDCAAYPNFVLSSGCDIPPLSPWENIEAFFRAAEEFKA